MNITGTIFRHPGLFFYLIMVAGGCRDKYNSPVHAPSSGFLVVEGYISNDTAATRIHLTRSVQLDSVRTVAEPGATVLVEAKSGGVVATLSEDSPGYYSGNTAAMSAADQYRLHIITSNQKEYLSDYSAPRNTPPIDSVTWATYAEGVKIYVSTHDPTGQTQNFHWEYDETWKYTSAYYSELIFQDFHFVTRDSAHQIYTCYRSLGSTTVIIASTTGLAKNEISQFPVADISYLGSNRLSNNYSVNVKQRTMSAEALNYYQLLAKNTEQLGSIFDAQPVGLSGNLHSLFNSSEVVIGFIECSAKTEKRLFIDRSQLPDVGITTGHGACIMQSATVPVYLYDSVFNRQKNIPLTGTPTDSALKNATFAQVLCVDCRAQGGTTKKPVFWP